jgi:hypothetical protein
VRERGGLAWAAGGEREEGSGQVKLGEKNFRNRIVQELWKLITVFMKTIPNIIKLKPLV